MNKPTHSISLELVKAYCEADYAIHIADGDIVLRVGEANPGLATLMRSYEVTTAAYLTAFNPFSAVSSSQENELNQSALIANIYSLGLKYVLGEGTVVIKDIGHTRRCSHLIANTFAAVVIYPVIGVVVHRTILIVHRAIVVIHWTILIVHRAVLVIQGAVFPASNLSRHRSGSANT